MPGTAARTLAWAADLFARVRKLRYEGIAIASRIPKMMITTRSSINVKPSSRLAGASRLESRETIGGSSLDDASGWLAPVIGHPERVDAPLRSEEHTSELQSHS